jgi:hypothetical protein
MEAARTFEMLVNFYQTTQCYSSEDSHLHTHHCENLRSCLLKELFTILHTCRKEEKLASLKFLVIFSTFCNHNCNYFTQGINYISIVLCNFWWHHINYSVCWHIVFIIPNSSVFITSIFHGTLFSNTFNMYYAVKELLCILHFITVQYNC